MKVSLLLMAIMSALSSATNASPTCPDITGTYISPEGAIVKYQQTGCDFINRYAGVRNSDGSIQYSSGETFPLDGRLVCNSMNACESFWAQTYFIATQLNFNGGVRTEEHGLCNHRQSTMTKDSQGNLEVTFNVYQCTDGFHGSVKKVFLLN